MVFGDIQYTFASNSFLEGCPETCTLDFAMNNITSFFSNLLLSKFIFSFPGISLEEKLLSHFSFNCNKFIVFLN